MPVNVLIADDQALVRAGFAHPRSAQPDIAVVGEAADGSTPSTWRAAAPRRRADGHPDARHRRHRGHRAGSSPSATDDRVLMLTTFDLDEYVYDALRAGASGFLLKDVAPDSCSRRSASSPPATR